VTSGVLVLKRLGVFSITEFGKLGSRLTASSSDLSLTDKWLLGLGHGRPISTSSIRDVAGGFVWSTSSLFECSTVLISSKAMADPIFSSLGRVKILNLDKYRLFLLRVRTCYALLSVLSQNMLEK
jgi:hypothetical protein